MEKELCARVWEAFLERLAVEPTAIEKLGRVNLKLGLICTDNGVTLLVHFGDPAALPGRCLSYSFGAADSADLRLIQDSDGFHRFWHGRQDVIADLVRGKIKADGDVGRALRNLPLLRPAFGLYPKVLQELGLNQLVLN